MVTRDELRTRLWPDVDFEHGLNAAVTRIRQALGDSAEQPRYIETRPKRGYRLIADVESQPPLPVEAIPPAPSPSRRGLPGWVIAAFVVTAAAGAGEARRLTADNRWSANPVWSEGGRSILFIFGQDSGSTQRELRSIKATGGQGPRRVAPLHNDVWEISAGLRLVYSRRLQDINIWRVTLPVGEDPPAKPELFISSTRVDVLPKYSPDGTKVAFVSARSGSGEI